MSLSLQDIQALFRQHGATQYTGEPVTQLEHALQTAALAEQEEAPPSLITASLLHDLGHMLEDNGDTPTLAGIDDLHQYRILPFLRHHRQHHNRDDNHPTHPHTTTTPHQYPHKHTLPSLQHRKIVSTHTLHCPNTHPNTNTPHPKHKKHTGLMQEFGSN